MKNLLLILIVLIASQTGFGQTTHLKDDDYNNSSLNKLTFVESIEDAKKLAQSDIEKGVPFLLIKSGIAPITYSTDSLFEYKFNIYYYDQGCTGADHKMMQAYNYEAFQYLERKFGKKWHKSVRKDVIGYKEWKRKN